MNCFGGCFGKKITDTIIDPIQKKTLKERLSPKKVTENKEVPMALIRKLSTQSPFINNINKQKNENFRNSTIRKKFLSFFKTNPEISRNNLSNTITTTNNKKINENPSIKPHWELKDKLRCLFCGGASCKHENWKKNRNSVIKGLNCDYITSDLIASQRPSTILIEEYNLIKEFKENQIGLIVNLQREGEHPYCGPNRKLELSSGFTYDPQSFISEDINVKLAGWKDMSVPDSLSFVLDTIKEMLVTIKLNKKKVLVHCHAGYGRTGVIIACYMLFDTNMETDAAIQLLRKKRPGTVQKKSQFSFCQRFKQYITRAKIIFLNYKISIESFMKNQKDILYGEEFYKYEYIPKILSETFDKIIEFKNSGKYPKIHIYQSMCHLEQWTDYQEERLKIIKNYLNLNEWEFFYQIDDISILSQLIYDWLEDSIKNVINPEKIDLIFEDKGLAFLISKHLEDYDYFNRENRKTLADNIKNELRTIEFETLICLANFANELKPENKSDKSTMNEFYNMLRRLSIQLLGFPAKSINKSGNIFNKHSHKHVSENIKTEKYEKNEISQFDQLNNDTTVNNNQGNNTIINKEINELHQNRDNILFYSDCLIDLIEFLGLIIRLDLSEEINENSLIRSPKSTKKIFSPYMTRRKTSELKVEKNSSFTKISRFAMNILEKETINNTNNILFNNQDVNPNEDFGNEEEFDKKYDDDNLINQIGKKNIKKKNIFPLLELKQCIKEESEEENQINYIKDKESNCDKDYNEKKKFDKNSNLCNLTSNPIKINNLNEGFFKEIYKILHLHFSSPNKLDDSNGPSFVFDKNTENLNAAFNNLDKTKFNNKILENKILGLNSLKNSHQENDDQNSYMSQKSTISNYINEKNNKIVNDYVSIVNNFFKKNTNYKNEEQIPSEEKYKISKSSQNILLNIPNSSFVNSNQNGVSNNDNKNEINPNFYYVSQINLNTGNVNSSVKDNQQSFGKIKRFIMHSKSSEKSEKNSDFVSNRDHIFSITKPNKTNSYNQESLKSEGKNANNLYLPEIPNRYFSNLEFNKNKSNNFLNEQEKTENSNVLFKRSSRKDKKLLTVVNSSNRQFDTQMIKDMIMKNDEEVKKKNFEFENNCENTFNKFFNKPPINFNYFEQNFPLGEENSSISSDKLSKEENNKKTSSLKSENYIHHNDDSSYKNMKFINIKKASNKSKFFEAEKNYEINTPIFSKIKTKVDEKLHQIKEKELKNSNNFDFYNDNKEKSDLSQRKINHTSFNVIHGEEKIKKNVNLIKNSLKNLEITNNNYENVKKYGNSGEISIEKLNAERKSINCIKEFSSSMNHGKTFSKKDKFNTNKLIEKVNFSEKDIRNFHDEYISSSASNFSNDD